MLRMVLGSRRRKTDNGLLETWVDWVKRATYYAENWIENEGAEMWILQIRRRQWRWALNLIQCTEPKWSQRAALWEPDIALHTFRHVGRPHKRWADDINSFVVQRTNFSDWKQAARDSEWWIEHEDAYTPFH